MPDVYHIIGQHNCVYCEYACNKLDELGIPYKYEEINSLHKWWFSRVGFTTVPQIWHYGKHIGGYEDLLQHLENTDGDEDE